MLNCPFCKNPYESESMVDGRCPNCGGKLNWSSGDQDESFDPGFTPNVTVSLGPSFLSRRSSEAADKKVKAPAVQPIELKINEDTVANKETVLPSDSVNEVGDENLREHSPSGSKSNYKRSLSTDDIDRLGGIWKAASLETSNPTSTLRTVTEESSQPLDVVINERRFQNVPEAPQFSMDYEILKQIGQGAVGVVYSAQQNSINRNVAVKMLNRSASQDEEQKDKFLFEAVVTGDLDHPNIVPIHDLGKNQDGELFYSMKQVVGTPWSASIQKKSVSENLEVLLKVCDAVSFAHAKGIVHRDLKPENTMLGQYGEVLVVDWGIALPFGNFSKMSDLLPKPGISGTPAYMAPEMATGPLSKIGPLSDVYLLGAILFEMITGKPPHRGLTVMDCVIAAADNHIVSTDNNGELIQIAYRAMATEPKDRYGSAAEFKGALHQYQSHLESISLANRAQEGLEEAKASGDYQEYAHAQFAFQEALDLWPNNQAARDGLVAVKLSYAQKALEQGDFELGLSLVDASDSRFKSLGRSLRAGLKEVKNRRRNVKRLVSALVIGSLISTFVFAGLFTSAKQAKNDAVDAEIAAKAAEDRERKAKVDAIESKDREEEAKNDEIAAKTVAVAAEKAAKAAKKEAEQGRIKLKKEELNSQRDSYFFSLGSVRKNLDFNEYAQARRKLEKSEENTTNLGVRHCEWGLLGQSATGDYLTLDSLSDEHLISSFAINKTSIALAYRNKFEVRSLSNIKSVAGTLDIENAKVVSIVPGEDGNESCWFVAGNSSDPTQGAWVGVIKKGQNAKLELTKLDKFAGLKLTCLAVSGGSKTRLLIGFSTGEIRIFDYLTGGLKAVDKKFEELVVHLGGVSSCDFHPESNDKFVTSGQDEKVMYFDLKGNNGALERKQFLGHEEPVQTVRFSSTGDSVASAGDGGTILYYPLTSFQSNDELEAVFKKGIENNKKEFLVIGSHLDAVRTLQFSKKSLNENELAREFLLSGGDDNQINIWNVPNLNASTTLMTVEGDRVEPKPLRTFMGHSRPVQLVSFNGDSANSTIPNSIYSLTSGAESGLSEFFQWSVATPAPIEDFQHDKQVTSTAISPDGKSLVLGTTDGISMVDLDRLPPKIGLELFSNWVSESKLEGNSNVWKEGHEYLAYKGLGIPSVDTFQQKELLLTCGGDDKTILWDKATGTSLQKFDRTGRRGLLTVANGSGVFATGASFKKEEVSTLVRVFQPLTTPANSQYFSEQPINLTSPWVQVEDDRPDLTVISSSDNGRWLVGGTSSGEVYAWQVNDPNNPIRKMGVAKSPVVNMEWISNGLDSEKGLQFLATFRNGLVYQFSLNQTEGKKEITRTKSIDVLNGIVKHSENLSGDLSSKSAKSKLKLIQTVLSPKKDSILCVIQETENEKSSARNRPKMKSSHIHLRLVGLGGEIKKSLLIEDSVCSAAVFRANSNDEILLATKLFQLDQVVDEGNEFIMLWAASTGSQEELSKLVDTGSEEPVVDLGFPFSKRELLMVRSDGPALISFESKKPNESDVETELTLLQGQGGVNCNVYSPDGKYILTGGVDGSAKIWSLQKKSRQQIKPVMKFQPFEQRSEAVGNEAGTELESWGEVTAVCFGKQGDRVVIGTQKGHVSIYDRVDASSEWGPGETLGSMENGSEDVKKVTAMALSPGEKHLLVGRINGTVDIYNFENFQWETNLKPDASVSCLAFSKNGELLIAGAVDSNAYLWRVSEIVDLDKQEPEKLVGHSGEIVSVEFSLDRTRVLTASKDKTAKLWSLNNFLTPSENKSGGSENEGNLITQVGTLASHNAPLVSAHFTHDGKNVVTTDTGFKSRLWRGSTVAAGLVLSPESIVIEDKMAAKSSTSEHLLDRQALVTLPSGETLEGYELVVEISPDRFQSYSVDFFWDLNYPNKNQSQSEIVREGNGFKLNEDMSKPMFASMSSEGSRLTLQFATDSTPDVVEKLIRSLGIRVTKIAGDGTEKENGEGAVLGELGAKPKEDEPKEEELNLSVTFRLSPQNSRESVRKSKLPAIELKLQIQSEN